MNFFPELRTQTLDLMLPIQLKCLAANSFEVVPRATEGCCVETERFCGCTDQPSAIPYHIRIYHTKILALLMAFVLLAEPLAHKKCQ